MITNNNKWW